jgi:hypothetical protein
MISFKNILRRMHTLSIKKNKSNQHKKWVQVELCFLVIIPGETFIELEDPVEEQQNWTPKSDLSETPQYTKTESRKWWNSEFARVCALFVFYSVIHVMVVMWLRVADMMVTMSSFVMLTTRSEILFSLRFLFRHLINKFRKLFKS